MGESRYPPMEQPGDSIAEQGGWGQTRPGDSAGGSRRGTGEGVPEERVRANRGTQGEGFRVALGWLRCSELSGGSCVMRRAWGGARQRVLGRRKDGSALSPWEMWARIRMRRSMFGLGTLREGCGLEVEDVVEGEMEEKKNRGRAGAYGGGRR